ncbi:hypothetical protein MSAN_01532400 [Mycena sanguinolenta]|uniref:Uncharacterized protein n=1 Tax=Mycena sanguinolenta TaxID=230812 RepID=A0A8H6Y6A9_9AGAR|nr:hypothetical protein MSAN_01532400 [Mycena sanguinolenta]
MPFISRAKTLLISTLLGISVASAQFCGDNGGAELGWGTQAGADANEANVPTVLGFNSNGPFDSDGNPILTVIATNAGFDASFYAFRAWICDSGSGRPSYGAIIPADGLLCLTASALETSNITFSMQPCVNDISTPPVATQTFEWNENGFITYSPVVPRDDWIAAPGGH